MCDRKGRFGPTDVPFWSRTGMYAIVRVPRMCDGIGGSTYAVCLIHSSSRDAFVGYSMDHDGRVIGETSGLWRNVEWLMSGVAIGEVCDLADEMRRREGGM